MDHEQKPAVTGQVSRLDAVRRKMRARHLRRVVLGGILILAAVLWLVCTFGSGMALAGDLSESLRIGLTPGGGFPVKTNIDEILQVEPLAGGFAELGRSDLAVVSSSGRVLRTIQHGYSRPAIAVGGHRFCLYGRAGTELRVESRTKTLDTMTFDNPLLLCSMAQNGSFAAVTRSGRFAAELQVYDHAMQFVFGWSPTDAEGTPVRVSFADDNRRLAVGTLRAEDGRIGSGIYWLNIRKDQVQASAWIPGSTVLELRWLTGDKLLAVFDTHTAVYEADTGTELARYEYNGGTLLAVDTSAKNTALLLNDGMGGISARLAVLDDDLVPLCETDVQDGAFGVVCTRTAAYSLAQNSVRSYTLAGELEWESPLTETPKALLDTKHLLLFTGVQADPLEPPGKKAAAEPESDTARSAEEPAQSEGENP